MSTLKSLAETIGMGFSPRNSKTKTRLGLHHFVAATTDQMLMTRGGYAARTPILGSCIHGSVGECNRFPCNLIDYTGGVGTKQTAQLLGFANWASNNGIDLSESSEIKIATKGVSYIFTRLIGGVFKLVFYSQAANAPTIKNNFDYIIQGDSIITNDGKIYKINN